MTWQEISHAWQISATFQENGKTLLCLAVNRMMDSSLRSSETRQETKMDKSFWQKAAEAFRKSVAQYVIDVT